jgi:predicted phage terminase large subunit-like protein
VAALTAWDYLGQQLEAPARKWATPGELAQAMDPKTRQTPALELIDRHLVDLLDTPDGRLLLAMSPQEGKSQRTSRWFPLWVLLQNPDTRIAIVSYEHGVARRWGRAIRDEITMHPELGLRVRDDLAAQHEWQLAGHDGGVYTAGIGAALTGRPVDCLRGGTMVTTESGYIDIRDLYQSANPPRVLSFNHGSGRAEWRRILAGRAIPDRGLVEVITTSGRRITCTPDHRLATSDGYRQAALLQPGDALLAIRQSGSRVRSVREDPEELGRGSDVPGVLHEGARLDVPDGDVLNVQHRVQADAGRAREEDSARPGEPVLLVGVRGEGADGSRVPVPTVRQADGIQGSRPPVLLEGVQDCSQTAKAGEGLPDVRSDLRVLQHSARVLHEGMCRPRALDPHGRAGQLALQDRHQLCAVVPGHEATDPGTRRAGVPCVPAVGPTSGASPEREAMGQPGRESDQPVPDLPWRASQVETDTVSVVRHLHGERDTVYDLQVEGNSNFFAGEVLVHNCLIIDDPIKDREQADSETYRQRAWDWWTDVGSTRLAPGAPVVQIATRWHEADLAGQLQAAEDGHLWTSLNIPAQADHDPAKDETDPLGREPGEFMISARGRTPTQWEAIKVRSGSRTWNALFQGRPAPAEGGMFKRDAWAWYDQPLWLEREDGSNVVTHFDDILMSWDMAFKDTAHSDYVVGQVWMRRGADAYLLDQVHGRMDFVTTCQRFRELAAKWPQATLKLVEDKANGTAVINSLRRIVPGIVPEEPHGSKEARAAAVTPLVEAGNVHLPVPELAPWIGGLVEEAAAFPNAANDDRVDSLTQALNRLVLAPLLAGDDLFEPEEFDELDQRGYAISPY